MREQVMFASRFLANFISKNDSFSVCQFYPVEALARAALESPVSTEYPVTLVNSHVEILASTSRYHCPITVVCGFDVF